MRSIVSILGLVLLVGGLSACESIGVGLGVGIPIGSRGGAGISIGGTLPFPVRAPEPAASSASMPAR